MVPPRLYRVMDANLNRAREGLRVCEEMARFILEESRLMGRCKRLRHDLNSIARSLPQGKLLKERNIQRDRGKAPLRGKASSHRGYTDLARANFHRVEEALRVMEEFCRLNSPSMGQAFGRLRFRVYSFEQALLSRLSAVRHR